MLKYIIITTTIVFLFIIHFLKYKKKKNSIDIIQINHIIQDYNHYIDENYPIILNNHDSKSIEKLYSPLSISSSSEKTQIKDFCYHLHDMLTSVSCYTKLYRGSCDAGRYRRSKTQSGRKDPKVAQLILLHECRRR